MFDSTILDVAIGLIFAFLTMSLAASAVTEAVSSALTWRSKDLLEGVKQLVNDPDFKGLALRLYQHAAVNPRGMMLQGTPDADPQGTSPTTDVAAITKAVSARLPAYIHPEQFATALMDVVGLSTEGAKAVPDLPAAAAAMHAAVDKALDNSNPQMTVLVKGIVSRSMGDLKNVEAALAAWFDASMDRVSGAYKRKAQLVSFIIAFALSAALNVDTLRVAHVLWEQPELAARLKLPADVTQAFAKQGSSTPAVVNPLATPVGETASSEAKAANGVLKVLEDHLPIGWPIQNLPRWADPPRALLDVLLLVSGWLITATATLFGAPFWFDTLQAFVRLKGSGPSPMEKKHGRAAAA